MQLVAEHNNKRDVYTLAGHMLHVGKDATILSILHVQRAGHDRSRA